MKVLPLCAGPSDEPEPTPLRILVVEDVEADFELFRAAIAPHGQVVLSRADRIQRAEDRLRAEDFDLVVLDLTLPDMAGVGGVEAVRRAAPDLPIVVLTGADDAATAVACIHAGAQDHLVKGHTDGQAMMQALRRAIERERRRRPLEEAADALLRREPNFLRLIATSPDGIVVVDEDGVVRFANAAAVELFRRPKDRLEGEPFDVPLAAGDATDIEVEGGRTVNTRVVETLWGDAPALLATFRDVTARVRVQEAFEASRKRLESLVERLPEGVALVEDDGVVVHANPMAAELLATLSGVRTGGVLRRVGQHTLAEIALRTEEVGRVEMRPPTDPERALHVSAVRIGDSPGCTLLILRDVSRELDIQRHAQTQDRLALVGQLASGAAHDFHNHLQVIVGHANLIQSAGGGLAEPLRHHVTAILEQARHASRVARQILDIGPGGGAPGARTRLLDLAELVTEAWRALARLIPADIEVVIDVAKGPAGSWSAQLDPTHLHQIITNLAINARDAMPAGGALRLTLSRLDRAADASPPAPGLMGGPWAVLSVQDTGTGIDPAIIDSIFDPFFTTKAPAEGTGLGLSQVYGLASQHGGAVDVHSVVGEGATFRIFLPLCQPAGAAGEAPPERAASHPRLRAGLEATTLRPGFGAPAGGRVVLVVEDDPDVRAVLASMLESLGFPHVMAVDGQEAVEQLAHLGDRVAVVLSDLTMPRMSGRQLLEHVAKVAPELPVHLLTAHDLGGEFEEYAARGARGWIQKPLDMDALADLLDRALEDKAGPPVRGVTPPRRP